MDNTLGEGAPLLASSRRKQYAASGSVRNAVAATLVAGCVLAVLAVSGGLGASEDAAALASAKSTASRVSARPSVGAERKHPVRSKGKKVGVEPSAEEGNMFTEAFDTLDVMDVVPDLTPAPPDAYAPGPGGPYDDDVPRFRGRRHRHPPRRRGTSGSTARTPTAPPSARPRPRARATPR